MFDLPPYVTAAAALVATSIPLLVWSLAGSRRPVVSPADIAAVAREDREAYLKVSALDRIVLPLTRYVGRQVRKVTPAGWVDSLDRRIKLAGSPGRWTVERVLAAKLALTTIGAVGMWIWVSGSGARSFLAAGFGALTGYVLLDAVLYGKARDRQTAILKALPDTLDQLTISVEAGLGFDAALNRVAASGSGPLAEELARVLAEIKVGAHRPEALKRLIERTDVQELRHFVLAVQQAEQFGLPIARVLRIQSGELRVKRRQRAEEEAMKVPVKIVFPLVVCIFPALFVVLLGPAMIRVMRSLL